MTSSKRGKEKICQHNSLLSKNIFQNEGELKTKIRREFISHRPLLQEMLQEFLQAEGVWHQTEIWFTHTKGRVLEKPK